MAIGWHIGRNARGPRPERAPSTGGSLTFIITKLVSFVKEILSFRSTFRHEIEKSSSIRELVDLLIIKNHFMS